VHAQPGRGGEAKQASDVVVHPGLINDGEGTFHAGVIRDTG
jgi:hypothetical protein